MSHRTLGTIVCAIALSFFAVNFRADGSGPPQPKAWITVEAQDLSLVWNADQGEAGRGHGEMYATIWVYWPSNVECTNPQHREFGPLGGDTEFPSGTLTETPPGSGNWSIVPATVPIVGQVYHCEANCPVADYIEVYVFVWESDSNKELKDYVKTIKDAVDAAAKDAGDLVQGLSFVQVVTAGIQVLIEVLTSSSDDEVGRFSGIVRIPDPCAGVFTVDRTVVLENLAVALWKDVHAEAEDGTEFGDPPYQIARPANIGTLRLKVLGGPCVNKFCAAAQDDGGSSSDDLGGFDFGQPDEATIMAWIETAACIPVNPAGRTYRVAYDTDNNAFTGCPFPGLGGAEYVVSCVVAADGHCAAQLAKWNPGTMSLVVVPGGIDDATFDIDRQAILVSVQRTKLGLALGELAARASIVVGNNPVPVSQLPHAGDPALTIPVSQTPSQVLPTVVFSTPNHAGIDVAVDQPIELLFSKSMNHNQTAAAVHLQPKVPLLPTWSGNRLSLQPVNPLQPDTDYMLFVEPFATDTVGSPFDGNNDLKPGDPFVLPFRTAPLPIVLTDIRGMVTGAFAQGESILMTADIPTRLPPGASAYIVSDVLGGIAPGEPLIDRSDDGPDSLLPIPDSLTMNLGTVAEEGEYHVVLDLDGDGIYSPPTDRIDRNSIGFAVLPDCDGSGVIDALEIAAGLLIDSDGDGKPDVCETPACPADLTGDGLIDGADLAILLGSWGPCGACAADVVADGVVDGADLAVLLGAWGACG